MSAHDKRIADIRERLHDAVVNGFPARMKDHAADDIRWLLDNLGDANEGIEELEMAMYEVDWESASPSAAALVDAAWYVIYGDSRDDFIEARNARRSGE